MAINSTTNAPKAIIDDQLVQESHSNEARRNDASTRPNARTETKNEAATTKTVEAGHPMRFTVDALQALTPADALSLLQSVQLGQTALTLEAGPQSDVAAAFDSLATRFIDASAEPPTADQVGQAFLPESDAVNGAIFSAAPQAMSAEMNAAISLLLDNPNLQGQVAKLSPEQQKRLELVKSYSKLMESLASKHEVANEAAQRQLQQLPQAMQKVLLEGAGKIAAQLQQLYGTKFEKAKNTGDALQQLVADSEIEIPSPTFVVAENAMRQLAGESDKTFKAAAEGKQQLDSTVLARVQRFVREDPKRAEKYPELGKLASHASAVRQRSEEPLDLSQGNGWYSLVGNGSFGTLPLMTGDIDQLIQMVMMQCQKLETDMLRDQMKEMQDINARKAMLREAKTKMKSDEARMNNEVQQEFTALKSTGALHSSVTIEDYKAWRQCQFATPRAGVDGKLQHHAAQLVQPMPEIPEYMRTGMTQDAQSTTASTTYGLPGSALDVARTIIATLPEPRPSLEQYLSDTLGLVRPKSIEDVTANLQKLKTAVQTLVPGEAPAAAPGVAGITAANIAANAATYKEVIENVIQAELLAKSLGISMDDMTAALPKIQEALEMWNRTSTRSDAAGKLAEIPPPIGNALRACLQQFDRFGGDVDGRNKLQEMVKLFGAQHNLETALGGKKFADEAAKTAFGEIVQTATRAAQAGLDTLGRYYQAWQAGPNESGYTTGGSLGNASSHVDVMRNGDMFRYNFAEDLNKEFGNGSWRNTGDLGNDLQMRGFTFGAGGARGHGYVGADREFGNSLGYTFSAPVPASGSAPRNAFNDELASNLGMLGKELGSSDENPINGTFGDVLNGMRDALGEATSSINTLMNAAAPSTAAPPPPPPAPMTQEDIDGYAASIDALIGDAGNPDTTFGGWVAAQDYDGARSRAATARALEEARTSGGGSGEGLRMAGLAQFSVEIQKVDDELMSTSEMSETAGLRLQSLLDRRSKLMDMLSNIMKKLSDTQSGIIKNIN